MAWMATGWPSSSTTTTSRSRPGSVGADVEVAVALVEHTDGVAHRVLDVQVTDAVFSGGVRDLHECRLPCPNESWQVTLLAILGYARFAPSARTSMPN